LHSSTTSKLTAALLTLACSGCVLHVHRDGPPPPGFEYKPPQTASEPFELHERNPVTLGTPTKSTRHHDVIPLSFRSSGHNGHPENLVEGEYFRSREPGRKKFVIVMPIWGTSTYPPRKVSTGYARRAGDGVNVLWVYSTAPVFPWAELASVPTEDGFVAMAHDSAERYTAAVLDIQRLIDWAGTQPDIDPTRIAIVGFSMSALVTATALANDSRIAAAVVMMGAAHFADVFTACGDKAGQVREHVLNDLGWSTSRYHDFFQDLFGPADPVRFPGHYDPDRILMIDAMFDDCMPESARSALWDVTGHPERITMMYRHRSSFYSLTPLGLNFARRQIYRFLDRKLDPPNTGAR
jgi:pimeloyl-ACP methyl ester carboxylesterase